MSRPDGRDTAPPGGGRFDEAGDATRRTRLANERTFLAWLRSGLTALAVAIATGKLVPVLVGGAQWPYTALGVGYALLGVLLVGYGFRRLQGVERAVAAARYARPDERIMALLTAFTVVLGAATLLVVLVES
jgi:putative membrane protein